MIHGEKQKCSSKSSCYYTKTLLSHQKNVWQNDKCYPETYSKTYAQLVMIQCIAWTVGVAFPQQTLKFHREVQILMIFKPCDCASEKKIVELLLLNLPTNSISRTLQIDNAIYHTSLYMKLENCKEFTLVKSFTDHNQD